MKTLKDIFNRLLSFFRRNNSKALPMPTDINKKQKLLNIQNYTPIAEINDKILWEITTWDKDDVKNKVSKCFLYLPNTGTPQQFFTKSPENFTQVFNTLVSNMKNGNVNFLGEIDFDEEKKGWSACTEDSKEMQQIISTTHNLIGKHLEISKIVKEMDARLSHSSNVQEESHSIINNNLETNEQTNLNLSKNPQPETIVISDLHSRLNSWLKIKKQIEDNPNLNVIVLGDAMDRGDYGLEILLQIKELSDTGRVKYVPGNHDEFAFNFMSSFLDRVDSSDKIYKNALLSLQKNGGKKTIEKILNFNKTVEDALNNHVISKPIKINELKDWLGNQPLQIVENGANDIHYALAHAIFDPKLYNYDSNFNLKKAYDMQRKGYTLSNNQVLKHFKNVLWYREENKDTHFAPVTLPLGHVVIVGHTPQKDGVTIKYPNNNYKQPMIFIDCGLINKLGGFSLNGHTIDNLEDGISINSDNKEIHR